MFLTLACQERGAVRRAKGAAGREPQVLLGADEVSALGRPLQLSPGSGSRTRELPVPVQPSSSCARDERLRFSRQRTFAARRTQADFGFVSFLPGCCCSLARF